MFISLTVKNFKTFKEETFFSMEREGQYRKVKNYVNYYLEGRKKRENRLQLLKSALILGNHHCGKTALIEAVLALRDLVLEGDYHYLPYGFNHEPILMAIEFIEHDALYRYAISYKDNDLLHEKLEVMNIKTQEYEPVFVEEEIHHTPRIQNERASRFFTKIRAFSEYQPDFSLLQKKENKAWLLQALQGLGFDFVDIEVKKVLHDEQVEWQLNGYHYFNPTVAVPLAEESTGLYKVMALLMWIKWSCHDGLCLIDDFEMGLYPKVASYLLYMLNHVDNETQYMITTRLALLMDETLSKDQLYILDRQEEEVYLSSLADDDDELFSLRANKKYSEGHFATMMDKEEWKLFID